MLIKKISSPVLLIILFSLLVFIRGAFLVILNLHYWQDELLILQMLKFSSIYDLVDLSKYSTYPFFSYLVLKLLSVFVGDFDLRYAVFILTWVSSICFIWFLYKTAPLVFKKVYIGLIIFFASPLFAFISIYIRQDFVLLVLLYCWFITYLSCFLKGTRLNLALLSFINIAATITNYFLAFFFILNFLFLIFRRAQRKTVVIYLIIQFLFIFIFLYLFGFSHLQTLASRELWQSFNLNSLLYLYQTSFFWYSESNIVTDSMVILVFVSLVFYLNGLFLSFLARKLEYDFETWVGVNILIGVIAGYTFKLFVFPRYSLFLIFFSCLAISMVIRNNVSSNRILITGLLMFFIYSNFVFFAVEKKSSITNEGVINSLNTTAADSEFGYISNVPYIPYLFKQGFSLNKNVYPIIWNLDSKLIPKQVMKNVILSEGLISKKSLLKTLNTYKYSSIVYQDFSSSKYYSYTDLNENIILSFLDKNCKLNKRDKIYNNILYYYSSCKY